MFHKEVGIKAIIPQVRTDSPSKNDSLQNPKIFFSDLCPSFLQFKDNQNDNTKAFDIEKLRNCTYAFPLKVI